MEIAVHASQYPPRAKFLIIFSDPNNPFKVFPVLSTYTYTYTHVHEISHCLPEKSNRKNQSNIPIVHTKFLIAPPEKSNLKNLSKIPNFHPPCARVCAKIKSQKSVRLYPLFIARNFSFRFLIKNSLKNIHGQKGRGKEEKKKSSLLCSRNAQHACTSEKKKERKKSKKMGKILHLEFRPTSPSSPSPSRSSIHRAVKFFTNYLSRGNQLDALSCTPVIVPPSHAHIRNTPRNTVVTRSNREPNERNRKTHTHIYIHTYTARERERGRRSLASRPEIQILRRLFPAYFPTVGNPVNSLITRPASKRAKEKGSPIVGGAGVDGVGRCVASFCSQD